MGGGSRRLTEGEDAMRFQGSSGARRNAKRLRQEMTPPELALWQG